MAFAFQALVLNPPTAIGPKAELAQALAFFEEQYLELQRAQELYANALRQISERSPEFKALRQRISELEIATMTADSRVKEMAKKFNCGCVGVAYEVEHVQPKRRWVDYQQLCRIAKAANIDLDEFEGLIGDPVVNVEQFDLLFAAGKFPEAARDAKKETPVSDKGRTTIKKREKKD